MPPRCRGGAIIRARRATSLTFIVRLPWSACYCGRLRWALQRLGLATMNDPFEDGSDNAAFFVATGSRTLAGRTMIRAYGAELEASASFDDVEARLAAIARVGVHEIIHDWKWLDCEADVSKLRQLGVRVQQLAETTDRGGAGGAEVPSSSKRAAASAMVARMTGQAWTEESLNLRRRHGCIGETL